MIEVFANGRKFSYWTDARVSRSLDHIAASFSLSLIAKKDDDDPVRLFPGDSVEISVDGTKVLRGYVDRLSTSFSSGSHYVNVSGSECSSDLADCCVESPFEWENKKMDEIIRVICAGFGLKFDNKFGVDVGKPFTRFSVEPGARAIDTIAKLCRERGILPCSDGRGKVYLLNPDKAKRGPALRQGENLISAAVDFSLVDRFSSYTVYGTGKAKDKVQAKSSDLDVVRSRPLIIIDHNAVEKDKVQARADWECKIRKAKSMGFRASVSGWKCDDAIWEPGVICSFFVPALFVNSPLDLLVSSVEYSWGASGAVTNMTLVQPDVFTPQPESSKKAKTVKKSKNDPWDSVKKAVQGK